MKQKEVWVPLEEVPAGAVVAIKGFPSGSAQITGVKFYDEEDFMITTVLATSEGLVGLNLAKQTMVRILAYPA